MILLKCEDTDVMKPICDLEIKISEKAVNCYFLFHV